MIMMSTMLTAVVLNMSLTDNMINNDRNFYCRAGGREEEDIEQTNFDFVFEEISKVNIFLNWKSISFSARKVGCVEKHQMIDEFTEIWFWREKKFLE